MATFDDNYFYGGLQNNGLSVCPFNSNHKMKPNKYQKHLLICEQRYPKRNSLKYKSNSSKTSILSEVEINSKIDCDFKANQTIDTISSADNKTANYEYSGDKDLERDHSLSSDQMNDNCIQVDEVLNEVQQSLNPIEHKSKEGENNIQIIPQDVNNYVNFDASGDETLTRNEEKLCHSKEKDSNNRRVNESVVEETNRKIESLTDSANSGKNSGRGLESDSKNVDNRCVNNEGSGDESWNCDYKHFSLFPEKSNKNDELNDDEIMQMAESFADIAVVTRMTKKQRKKFNEKLVELSKLKSERKLQAFNDLISFSDKNDKELKKIPSEIRKPKIDIRKTFRIRKVNIDSSAEEKTAHEKCTTSSSPMVETLTVNKVSSDEKNINVICNGCSDSLVLNESNVKRMSVFCAKCSGFKFGGYFECHSCKLYGYFANNKIDEHLKKHFPHVSKSDENSGTASAQNQSIV
jgi:hypothetical protein